jgi:hypothetical protein
MRKGGNASDIAHRPDALLSPHPAALIYREKFAGLKLNIQGFQAQAFQSGRLPGGQDKALGGEGTAVLQGKPYTPGGRLYPDHPLFNPNLNSVFP